MKKTQVTQISEKSSTQIQPESKRSSIVNVATKKAGTQNTVTANINASADSQQKKDNPPNSQIHSGRQLIDSLVNEQNEALKPVEIEKSLTELLGKFLHISCSQHKIREYDHICINKKCAFNNAILCSKCILQDEKHSIQCKNDFNSLEKYVPLKVDQISGKLERLKIEQIKQNVNKIEKQVNQTIQQMRDRVENDLSEIIGSVTALCAELKISLNKQIDQYQNEQKSTIQRYNTQIQKNYDQIIKEGQIIENSFKEILINNFDYSNFYQVNEFMKKVREKENTFSAQQFVLEINDNLEEFKYDLNNNKYYKSRHVAYIKNSINSLLQNALKNSQSPPSTSNKFKKLTAESRNTGIEQIQQEYDEEDIVLFDFTRLKLQGQHLLNYKRQINGQKQNEQLQNENYQDPVVDEFIGEDNLQDWYENYDKKSIVIKVKKEFQDPKIDSSMISLQQKALLQTDHKLSINSIATINHNTFATCGNEQKVKIWGFTQNYVIHLKATIELGDLGVQVAYHKQQNCLYVATSRGVIQVYQMPQDVSSAVDLNPTLVKEYVAHKKTVRNISFLPYSYNQLLSISYDKTIKVWNINEQVEQQNALIASIDLPQDEDCKFLEANGLYTIVGCISGNILIYQNNLVDTNQQHTLQSTIRSKRSERSAAFGPLIRRQPKYQVTELKFLAKLKCSKEKISSIILGSKNPDSAFIGSGNGTITVLDLSKLNQNHEENQEGIINQQLAKQGSQPTGVNEEDGEKFKESFNEKQIINPEVCISFKLRRIHKQRISSLNLFEDKFLLAMSWDGLCNLYDISKQKVISSTKYVLQNDEKKHSDGFSAKISVFDTNKYHILSIGNNDKQVQVFSLQLFNEQ